MYVDVLVVVTVLVSMGKFIVVAGVLVAVGAFESMGVSIWV